MFSVAVLIGVYAYLIFALGTIGLLYPIAIFIITVVYGFCLYLYYRKLWSKVLTIQSLRKLSTPFLTELTKSVLMRISLILLGILALISLVGALGPEYAFDALWYHLTLPKLYLLTHSIQHISGGLLYYSDMPRLGEMLYVVSLAFTNEIGAKVLHWLVGLAVVGITYHASKKMLGKKWALLASLLFYSNIVVSWESTTAYIDLFRAFFEVMAFWGFLHWMDSKKKKWFIESAVMVGLAIACKILAISSLAMFAALILYQGRIEHESWKVISNRLLQYGFVALLIASPWFITAFLTTGNPFYPIFSSYEVHQTVWQVLNPLRFVQCIWTVFTHADDPISPLYLIVLPLAIVSSFRRGALRQLADRKDDVKKHESLVYLYSLVAILVWYGTPQTGGGRFMLPYLPVLSIASILLIKRTSSLTLQKFLVGLLLLLSVTTIFYRGMANVKFLPVLFGRESKAVFLTKHLNFSYGDFYDTDGMFEKNIKPSDTVLLYGFHNLYYVNFPFIDSSWVKPGDRFDYIAVQNGSLPKRFSFWQLVYSNPVTHVNLYSYHQTQWIY